MNPTRATNNNISLAEFLNQDPPMLTPYVHLKKHEYENGNTDSSDPENIKTEVYVLNGLYIKKNNYARLYTTDNKLTCFYIE
jgi:hypothetical protein